MDVLVGKPKTHFMTSNMKRYNNLFLKICSIDNLYLAEAKARRGKTKSYGVRMFDKNKDENILKLHDILINKQYKTSNYTTFTIFEPKERLIFRLPYYPDRIVHHAVMNVLEDIWTKTLISHTYSCIKNRGIHRAVNDLKHDLRKDIAGTQYCLKLDIRHFYPSIDHQILKNIIRKKIKDKDLLELLDEIIDSAVGVPIGNYLSQFFANLYLSYFDHWLKENKHVKYYYRYADDIVILSDDKLYLRSLFLNIETYLNLNLNLKVKSNWQIFSVEIRGIDFLGYVFRHTYTKLRKTTKRKLFKKVIQQSSYNMTYKLKYMLISSYFGWLKYCNSHKLKNKLNSYYNEKIFL